MPTTVTDDDDRCRALAHRAYLRLLAFRQRHPGRSVPINDTFGRILAHDPEYPRRKRAVTKPRRPLLNPGIFTVKRIADDLETTVGELLGEPGYQSARDLLTEDQRQTLRDAWLILRDLFGLADPER